MHNKITRRKFIKWAAIVAGIIGVSTFLSFGGKTVLDRTKTYKKACRDYKGTPN